MVDYIATMTLSNTCGIGIIDITNDRVTYQIRAWNEVKERPHKSKIYYTPSGRAYIRFYNIRFYLDEFIRMY